ncbi:MAG: CHASE1-domain containing sensor protein, partial [Nitrospinales bacterium]
MKNNYRAILMNTIAKQTQGIFISGLILAVIGFGILWDRQHRAWFGELEQEVLEDSLILTGELEVIKRELLGIISLYNSSEYVTREEFGVYVQPLLDNHPFIQAFEWAPLIGYAEKDGFESITRSMGYPDFKVRGSTQPRQEYLPVHYAEPLSGNEQVLGFDLKGDKELHKVVNTARDTGKTIAVSSYGRVPNAKSRSELFMVAPYYEGGKKYSSPEERREYLKGFVLGVYRIRDMVDQMVKPYVREGMNLLVYEGVELKDEDLVYGSPLKNSSMEITNIVTVANKRWFLVWQATDDFRGGPGAINAFIASAGIFAVALFFSIIVELMASRTRVVEK